MSVPATLKTDGANSDLPEGFGVSGRRLRETGGASVAAGRTEDCPVETCLLLGLSGRPESTDPLACSSDRL